VTDLGPWFLAGYFGACADCGEDIEPGDVIRADGESGYLCEACGQEDDGG
jgi:hypothetical protein